MNFKNIIIVAALALGLAACAPRPTPKDEDGRKVGLFTLGQAIPEEYVTVEPIRMEAGMGHEADLFRDRDDAEIGILRINDHVAESEDGDEDVWRIEEILTRNRRFRTPEGLGVGATLTALKKAYPDLEELPNAGDGRLGLRTGEIVWDSMSKGVGFAVDPEERCAAVLVHPLQTMSRQMQVWEQQEE